MGYLVHLLVGVTAVGSTVLLFVMLGALVSVTARPVEVRSPAWAPAASWAVAALAAALLVLAGTVPVADNAYARGLSAGSVEAALPLYRRASSLAPWSETYRARVATAQRDRAQAALAAAAAGDKAALQVAAEGFSQAEAAGLRLLALAPGDMLHPAFLVNLYTQGAIALDPALMDRALRWRRLRLPRSPRQPMSATSTRRRSPPEANSSRPRRRPPGG